MVHIWYIIFTSFRVSPLCWFVPANSHFLSLGPPTPLCLKQQRCAFILTARRQFQAYAHYFQFLVWTYTLTGPNQLKRSSKVRSKVQQADRTRPQVQFQVQQICLTNLTRLDCSITNGVAVFFLCLSSLSFSSTLSWSHLLSTIHKNVGLMVKYQHHKRNRPPPSSFLLVTLLISISPFHTFSGLLICRNTRNLKKSSHHTLQESTDGGFLFICEIILPLWLCQV